MLVVIKWRTLAPTTSLFHYLYLNKNNEVLKSSFLSFNAINNANGQIIEANSYDKFLHNIKMLKIYKKIESISVMNIIKNMNT